MFRDLTFSETIRMKMKLSQESSGVLGQSCSNDASPEPFSIVIFGRNEEDVISTFDSMKSTQLSGMDVQDFSTIKVEQLPDLIPDYIVFSRIDEFDHLGTLKVFGRLGASGIVLIVGTSVTDVKLKLLDYGLDCDSVAGGILFIES